MKTRQSLSFAGMMFALLTTVAAAPAANAAPLLSTGTGSLETLVTPDAWQDAGGGAVYSAQPLTNVLVGELRSRSQVSAFTAGPTSQAPARRSTSCGFFSRTVCFRNRYSLTQTVTNQTARWFNAPVGLQLAAGRPTPWAWWPTIRSRGVYPNLAARKPVAV